jgi:outer membrane lipoprotein-sorting protein
MVQKGQKFRVNNAGNELICDGKVVWMYQKSGAAANSVQINDYDPNDEEMVSPANIMKIYENEKKFIYAIVNDNPTAQEIEFKPLDKKADYSKIRITVDKSLNTIKQVKIFGKDGIRYTLDIKRLDPANYPDTHFTFDKAKYPGVKVSDLRE